MCTAFRLLATSAPTLPLLLTATLLAISAPIPLCAGPSQPADHRNAIAWPTTEPAGSHEALSERFPPPAGFVREPASPGSFAAFLRNLPLRPVGTPVKLHTGALKGRQDIHSAVVDIDTGTRDLQQCADAVMRLRAEWLWAAGRSNEIAFDYTSGARVPFSRWAKGERPSESGKTWRRSSRPDASYASLRRYLVQVFSYAGTYSLARELKPIAHGYPEIGDVFIVGGFPGHAVLVGDVATEPSSGARRLLLLQSYMPAQDIHVLRTPTAPEGSVWYEAPVGAALVTPEWTFPAGSLKRWR